MQPKAAYAVMCVVLATGLACGGCGAAPNSAASATSAGTIAPAPTATQAPTAALAATALPTNAAQAGAVDVRGVVSYVDSSNTFHADGFVTNNTRHPVNDIELHLVATNLLAPAGDASGADHTPYVIRIKGPVKAGARPAYYLKGMVDPNAATPFRTPPIRTCSWPPALWMSTTGCRSSPMSPTRGRKPWGCGW